MSLIFTPGRRRGKSGRYKYRPKPNAELSITTIFPGTPDQKVQLDVWELLANGDKKLSITFNPSLYFLQAMVRQGQEAINVIEQNVREANMNAGSGI